MYDIKEFLFCKFVYFDHFFMLGDTVCLWSLSNVLYSRQGSQREKNAYPYKILKIRRHLKVFGEKNKYHKVVY